MIVAGITLFQPDLERLNENIESIVNQVDDVVCIDNGSDNIVEIRKLIEKYKKVSLIENGENVGIAKALNQMFIYAKENEHEWVLTLDQDSVCPDNIIREYRKYLSIERLGMLCPLVDDRNYVNVEEQNGDIEEVQRCITSASLVPVTIWEAIDGFLEELFIDFVDHDFCAKLQEKGYKIIRVNAVHLLHEIGNGKDYKIAGIKLTALNHSAFRKYYMARNWYYYIKAHKSVLNTRTEWTKYYFFFLKTMLFEENKGEKWKAMVRGNRDAKKLCKKLL